MDADAVDELAMRVRALAARAAVLLGSAAGADDGVDALDGEALEGTPLGQVRDAFGLDALELEMLACLVAAEREPIFRLLLRTVQRDASGVELGTIAELLRLDGEALLELIARARPEGRLRSARLVIADESGACGAVAMRLRLDGEVARRLLGEAARVSFLVEPAALPIDPSESPSLARVELRAATARARAAWERRLPLVVEVSGAPGCGRRRVARALAAALGSPIVVAELDGVRGAELSARIAAARREATLRGALLAVAGAALVVEEAPALRAEDEAPAGVGPRRLAPEALAMLSSLRGPMVLIADAPEPLLVQAGISVEQIIVPFPLPSERAALVDAALRREGAEVVGEEAAAIARRFSLDPRRLGQAVTAAVASAPRSDDGRVVIGGEALVEACRAQLSHDLASIASRVPLVHAWEDLVVTEEVYDVLCEMVSFVAHAGRVYDEWGFGGRGARPPGVSALFAGPPGTGKTMCASVMARELGMELFRVDLSRVMSKWIGETEKNLSRLFDEAERSNAILLFDEADSLFAKRTEVKSSVDRYANLEVNYLLQRIESFSGVSILTTNLEDSIDPAFRRRLTFRCHFEKPDAAARAALWEKALPARCPLAEDVDLAQLGALFELSGGPIKNAARRAAFAAAASDAGVLDMATLLGAAERESREMGLLVRSVLPSPAPVVAKPAPATPTVPRAPSRSRSGGPPRLVPVTHRRSA